MPPVFEQPGGGGGQQYSQLASALQSRYAADAERQQRGQIAYQELADRRIAEQRNYELGAARLQLQPILQEQQARNEMDNWMQRQQFNQQDQAELNRQNALVSELLDKHDKGEISDGELYSKIRQQANRVNFLQAKEQHTKNAAINEQRKMFAQQHAEQGKLIAQRTELFKKTAEDRVSFVMDPTAHDQMGKEVDTLQPGLNPAAREEAIRFRAEQQGLGRHFLQQDIGKWLPLEKGLTAAQALSATEAKGKQQQIKPFDPVHTLHAAQAVAQAEGLEKDSPEFTKRVQEVYSQEKSTQDAATTARIAQTPEGKAQAVEKQRTTQIANLEGSASYIQQKADLPPEQKQQALTMLGYLRDFVRKHGVPKPGTDLDRHYQKVYATFNKLYGHIEPPGGVNTAAIQTAQSGDERIAGGLLKSGSLVGQAIQGAASLDTPIGGGN